MHGAQQADAEFFYPFPEGHATVRRVPDVAARRVRVLVEQAINNLPLLRTGKETSMSGAPRRNLNAVGHGLYSAHPTQRITVPANVDVPALAVFAEDMGAAAQAIAQHLATALEALTPNPSLMERGGKEGPGEKESGRVPMATKTKHDAARMIGLYASVAQELHHLAAELQGETGIKPAGLGKLTEAQFDTLMAHQAAALSLILSQCRSAWQHIKDREDVLGDGIIAPEGINITLNYLAGHMRSAKRIMREMAADLAWRQRGTESDDDLGSRLLNILNTKGQNNE